MISPWYKQNFGRTILKNYTLIFYEKFIYNQFTPIPILPFWRENHLTLVINVFYKKHHKYKLAWIVFDSSLAKHKSIEFEQLWDR